MAEWNVAVKMPWEVDGLRWHTQGRSSQCRSIVPAHGEMAPAVSPIPTPPPGKWDVRIFDAIMERIDSMDGVETDWNDRNVIRIASSQRSAVKFLHIFTNDEWLLKLSFRVAKNTFQREKIVPALNLRPLNEFPELPLYGTSPRVQVIDAKEGFQEIELRVHYWNEFNRNEMWAFFEQAQESFNSLVQQAEDSPGELKPWKIMGRKWHESSKGFLGNTKPAWRPELIQTIIAELEKIAPNASWGWQNKTVVSVTPLESKKIWARLTTKRPDAVYLELFNEKNLFPRGRISEFGFEPEINERNIENDCLRFSFRNIDDWQKADFPDFLTEHFLTTVKKKK